MELPFTGGCACGKIRYECSAKPLEMFFCHCRDCQQAGGGGYTAGLLVAKDSLNIEGEAKYFSTPSLAGGMHTRGFCPNCGARLFGAVKPEWNFIGIVAGSLDDPSWFKPKKHFFVADALPWVEMTDELPKFDTYQPRS